jgi:hypothetical protein
MSASTCLKCDMPCQGRWCSTCEVEETAPDLDSDQHDCPHCGGPTTGEGVTCANCRRVGDVLDKEMDGHTGDEEDEEVTA